MVVGVAAEERTLRSTSHTALWSRHAVSGGSVMGMGRRSWSSGGK